MRLAILFPLAAVLAAPSLAQTENRDAEFKKLATQIAAQRQAGGEEDRAAQERALTILDDAVIATMNAPVPTAGPNRLPWMNVVISRLQSFTASEFRIGESYVVVQVGAENPSIAAVPVFALIANFSLSGPSAIRLYEPRSLEGAGERQRWTDYRLVGRIDRFEHTEFFDEYLEAVAVNPAHGVFVTVTGRTDDRRTGAFSAWRFSNSRLQQLWSSELLERSSYEAKDGVLRIEFCSETDEDKPSVCRKMTRELYAWNAGWTRTAQEDITPKQ